MRLTVPLRRPLGLAVADQSYNAAFGMLGVRFGHGFTWAGGQSVLTGYLARCLTSGRLNLGMTASFVGAGFGLRGHRSGLGLHTSEIGVNFFAVTNYRWSRHFNPDAQCSRGRWHNAAVNAGIESKF